MHPQPFLVLKHLSIQILRKRIDSRVPVARILDWDLIRIRSGLNHCIERKAMIALSVVTRVIPKKQGEFLESFRSLKGVLDKKEISGKSTLYQEVEERNVFNWVCELGTKEDLRTFFRAEEFKALLGAFTLLCAKSRIRWRYHCRNWPCHSCPVTERKRTGTGRAFPNQDKTKRGKRNG